MLLPLSSPTCPLPGEFLRAKVSEPLGARAFVGVRQDELEDYAPVGEIGIGFLFGNSLLPKALGSGVDFGFIELCNLFNNFRKMIGDFKPPFKEMDFNKGVGSFYNQVLQNRSGTNFEQFLLTGYRETRGEQQRQWKLLGSR